MAQIRAARRTVFLTLIALASCFTLQRSKIEANQSCEAPPVLEGETGKITGIFSPEVFSSQDAFVSLKRADNPGDDIVVCTNKSQIKCDVRNPQYKLHDVANDSFTLHIPEVTTDFDDTYILLVHSKKPLQQTDFCHLVVKARPDTCEETFEEGQTGKLRFVFRPDILASQDFFATLRRAKNPGKDILVCTRRSPVQCHISNPQFESKGMIGYAMTLLIPNVSKDFDDTYVFKIYANRSSQPFIACVLHVKEVNPEVIPGIKTSSNTATIAAAVVCSVIVLLIPMAVWLFVRCKKSKQQIRRPENYDESPMLPLRPIDSIRDDVRKKRWFYGQISSEEEARLLQFRRNGPGSFLIKHCHTNPDFLILAVSYEDQEAKHFRVVLTQEGYSIRGAGESFDTLPELVDYYRQNDMINEGKAFGKLGKPVEKEPEEVWFAGKLTREEEKKLFASHSEEKGSFLIRDNITYPDCYTIAVNVGACVRHYRISVNDNGFHFCDANTTFGSLSELVHYYQENDILIRHDVEKNITKQENLGKLCGPVSNDEEEGGGTSTSRRALGQTGVNDKKDNDGRMSTNSEHLDTGSSSPEGNDQGDDIGDEPTTNEEEEKSALVGSPPVRV